MHKLNGTGGTMGFVAMSQALEARLAACLKAGGVQPGDVAAIAAGAGGGEGGHLSPVRRSR